MAGKKLKRTSKSVKHHFSFESTKEKIQKAIFAQESPFFQSLTQGFVLAGLLISGILLCVKGNHPLGVGLLAAGVVLIFAKFFIQKFTPALKYGLLILGILLVAESFSVVHDYSPLLPQGLLFHFSTFTGVVFLLGCLLLFLGFRYFSHEQVEADDVKSLKSLFLLTFFLGFSAWTTFINLDVPDGYQCDDADAPVEDVMDFKDLHQGYLIDGYGMKEAGPAHVTAFLWNFIPNESSIHIQFLGNELFALLNLVFVYLLGREVGGARVGLIFAALMTFGKWVPSEVISGYFSVSATWIVSWCLFVFFRLVKKGTWFHFIHFGFALGLGAYMYPAFRLFGLFMIISSVLILSLKKKEASETASGLWVAGLGCAGWSFWFFLKNKFFNFDPKYHSFLGVLYLLFAVFLTGFLIRTFFEYRKNKSNETILKWSLSAFLALLLSFPMMSDPAYGARFSVLNPLAHQATLSVFINKIFFTFQAYFMGDGIFGTSGFDFQTACCVVLGLMFFLGRPDWKTAFIFTVLWVGLIPHFFPDYTYNGRAAAGIPPFLLLAALALEQLRLLGLQLWSKKSWNAFFLFLMVGFFGWQAWTSYQSIYHNQIYHRGIEPLVSRQIIKDSPGCRVYLTLLPYCSSPECQGVMDEGHAFYVFNEKNPIYLSPSEKLKDLVVIVFAGDSKLTAELKKQFPDAQWEGISFDTFHYPKLDASDKAIQFYRVFISASQITTDSKKAIFVMPGVSGTWLRDFYWFSHRVGEGAIYGEDRVNQLALPFPVKGELKTARFKGPFYAKAEGNYEFSVQDPNFAVLEIDHRKVIDNRSGGVGAFSDKRLIHLTAGEHQIDYSVYFIGSQSIPDIKIKVTGSDAAKSLDDFSIN